MDEVAKQSKNRNPDAPIRSDGNVSNLLVSASAPKMPRARKLTKNHGAPIDGLRGPGSCAVYASCIGLKFRTDTLSQSAHRGRLRREGYAAARLYQACRWDGGMSVCSQRPTAA